MTCHRRRRLLRCRRSPTKPSDEGELDADVSSSIVLRVFDSDLEQEAEVPSSSLHLVFDSDLEAEVSSSSVHRALDSDLEQSQYRV